MGWGFQELEALEVMEEKIVSSVHTTPCETMKRQESKDVITFS